MKLALYLFGFVFFCFAGFLSLGLLFPSIQFESTVSINRPLAKSWRIFDKKEYTKEWILGLKKIEAITDTASKSNAKYKFYFDDHGKEVSIIETSTKWEFEKEYAFTMTHAMMDTETIIHFSKASENATLISASNKVVGKNLLFKSLFFLLRSSFQEKDQVNYDRLKKFIESKAAADL